MSLTPNERVLRAKIAASTRWANEPDRVQATTAARAGLRRSFETKADPDGTLPPAEREYRVDQLMRAHMLRMTLKAAQAKRAKTLKRAS